MLELLISLLLSNVQEKKVDANNNIIYLTPDKKAMDACKASSKNSISHKEYKKGSPDNSPDNSPDISEEEMQMALEAACFAISSDQIRVTDEEYKKYMSLKTKAAKVKYEKELLLTHEIIKY